MNTQLRVILVSVLILGIFLGLAGLTYVNFLFSTSRSSGEHFVSRWMGARYWIKSGISPYDETIEQEVQKKLYNRAAIEILGEDKGQFLYPLTAMLFLAPFGLMEFDWALSIWMTILEISIFFIAYFSLKLVGWQVSPIKFIFLLLFSLFNYHNLQIILNGQISAVIALFIVLGLLFTMKKQDFLAGIAFALTTIKPTAVFLLIPFIVVWALSVRRYELFWSFLLSTIVLFLAVFAFYPNWFPSWITQLIDYASTNSNLGSGISRIIEAFPGIKRPFGIFLYSIIGIYLIYEFVFALKKNENHFLWIAMLIIVFTNLIGYRTSTSNFVLMLPVLFLIFQAWENKSKYGGNILVTILVILIWSGIWGLALIPRSSRVEPLYLLLVLPIFCLFGLWWIRWWYLKPPLPIMDNSINVS